MRRFLPVKIDIPQVLKKSAQWIAQRENPKNLLVLLQVMVLLGLIVLLVIGLQRDDGSIGLSSEMQRGACVAWVNAADKPVDRGPLRGGSIWPAWSERQVSIDTARFRAHGWDSENAGSVAGTIAVFLTDDTANAWNLPPTQPHFAPDIKFNEVELSSKEAFSVLAEYYDYGGIEIRDSDYSVSMALGLKPRPEGSSTPTYLDVIGAPESHLTLAYADQQRQGQFGAPPWGVYLSFPPRYPEEAAKRLWGGALISKSSESRVDCLPELAPARSTGVDIIADHITDRVEKPLNVRVSRHISRLVISGTLGTITIEGASPRPIGPEDAIDLSAELGYLSLDSDRRRMAFYGSVTGLTINGKDVRSRAIDSWPWYFQALLGVVVTWAVNGLVQSLRKD